MKVLFIGDIFGTTGVRAVETELKKIISAHKIDYVIANAENTTSCRGLNLRDYKKLCTAGVDFITMGNHTWKQKEVFNIIEQMDNIIRPGNILESESLSNYGVGSKVVQVKNKKIRITNVMGKTLHFGLAKLINPFIYLEEICENDQSDIHILDFHSETTSEKNCLLRSFGGRITAILGTHTHVQTNDSHCWNGTLYITDVGMTGPSEGVIGAKVQSIKDMFYEINERFILEENIGLYQFCAVVLEFDDKSNQAISIKNIYIRE